MKRTRTQRVRRQSQKGFTLIEIIIVLAVLAVLAAVVVPNVSGYFSRSKDNAYKSDQRMIQAAVDAWRSDTTNRSGGNTWPVVGSTNTISVPALSGAGYLRGDDSVASANTSTMTGATNSPAGTYTWGINLSTGVVTSTPPYTPGSGVYP